MEFQRDFARLGIEPGSVLLMHSSMKSLGTQRTPAEFLRELIDYLGPGGTLLLPALTYATVRPESSLFDVRSTEPCVGLLPRTFFHMPGVLRSLHPTHSVCALGKYAKELTAGQELDETPLGPHSPFRKLPEYGGKILMLGVDRSLTFMHGVEEVAGAPYTLSRERTHYVVVDQNGTSADRYLFTHHFNGLQQRYHRAEGLLSVPEIQTGFIGKSWCRLYDAAALMREGVKAIRRDPYYFVADAEQNDQR